MDRVWHQAAKGNINMNTKFNADIVITGGEPFGWHVWSGDELVADIATKAMLDMLVAGASAQRQSVYDRNSDQFLTGTVEQLVGKGLAG
jgi:isopentenyl phosphate kinase